MQDENPSSDRFEKILENDFFDKIVVITDKNKKIYQIKLSKDTYSVYDDGNKLLDKLKNKHGSFNCSEDINSLFGKIGDTCINNLDEKFEVRMSTWTWGSATPTLSLTYASSQYLKLIGDKDDLSKL